MRTFSKPLHQHGINFKKTYVTDVVKRFPFENIGRMIAFSMSQLNFYQQFFGFEEILKILLSEKYRIKIRYVKKNCDKDVFSKPIGLVAHLPAAFVFKSRIFFQKCPKNFFICIFQWNSSKKFNLIQRNVVCKTFHRGKIVLGQPEEFSEILFRITQSIQSDWSSEIRSLKCQFPSNFEMSRWVFGLFSAPP